MRESREAGGRGAVGVDEGLRPERPDATFTPASEAAAAAADSADAVPEETASGRRAAPGACLLMGPGSVGKTTLVAAIDQACNLANPGRGRPDLEFVGGPETGALFARAVQQILGQDSGIEHTTEVGRYDCTVSVRQDPPGGIGASMRLSFVDGPGGALFPQTADIVNADLEDWEEELVARGRDADALVLCLDPNDEAHCALTYRYVSGLLARLVTEQRIAEPRSGRPYARALARFGWWRGEPVRRSIRRLKATRFLLLFTKVDVYASTLLAAMDPAIGCSPRQLAAQLDPVAQAADLLGDIVLRRIHAALPPGARLAVGFCSNWGFDPAAGDPFMPDGRNVRGLDDMPRDRRPADWTPFGVREAVDFIVTGVASGPIHLVQLPRLDPRNRRRAFDVPLRAEWGDR